MLNNLIDKLQAKFAPNRLVALAMAILIPTVITPGAAFLAAWVPAHFPGLPAFTAGQLTAFAITGGGAALLAATTAGYQWIDGWQFDEARKHGAEQARLEREHQLRMAIVKSESPHTAVDALDLVSGGGKSQPEPGPSPDSPSAAVSGAVPPPPPSFPLEVPRTSPAAPDAPSVPETVKGAFEPAMRQSSSEVGNVVSAGAPATTTAATEGGLPDHVSNPQGQVVPAMPPPPPSTDPDPPIEG